MHSTVLTGPEALTQAERPRGSLGSAHTENTCRERYVFVQSTMQTRCRGHGTYIPFRLLGIQCSPSVCSLTDTRGAERAVWVGNHWAMLKPGRARVGKMTLLCGSGPQGAGKRDEDTAPMHQHMRYHSHPAFFMLETKRGAFVPRDPQRRLTFTLAHIKRICVPSPLGFLSAQRCCAF